MYGRDGNTEKSRLWKELLDMKYEVDALVMLMGDFNKVRQPHERKGCTILSRSMEEFDEWISDMGMLELPLNGRKFTWRRGTSCSKLERVLVEPKWLQSCVSLKVSAINCSLSNHIPLLLETEEVNWGPKPFWNLDTWFSHPCFLKVVEDEWRSYGNTNMLEKLKKLRTPLRRWNRESSGCIDFNIQKLESKLKVMESKLDDGSIEEVDTARYQAIRC